ncbi:hypothetical protein [Dokdonella sp.]|uniref:hypothetical protein n=1 Tax=Dokdonella sp. TaxID=2291710 RepID=UPI002614F4DE|nr:hypothetical protein [Dokdonella sp.]
MALIPCPECRKEVSDKAPSCPNCGCPFAAHGGGASQGSTAGEIARTGGKVATTWLLAGQVHWVVRGLVAIVAILGLFLFLAFSGPR